MAEFQRRNVRASKLGVKQVQDIRKLYGRGDCTQGQLARDYGVSVVQIGRIVRGEVWQGLPQEVTAIELDATAKRLLELQQSLVDKMNDGIAAERELAAMPDKMVDELKGEHDAGY